MKVLLTRSFSILLIKRNVLTNDNKECCSCKHYYSLKVNFSTIKEKNEVYQISVEIFPFVLEMKSILIICYTFIAFVRANNSTTANQTLSINVTAPAISSNATTPNPLHAVNTSSAPTQLATSNLSELSAFLNTKLDDTSVKNCSVQCANGTSCRSRYIGYNLMCSK